MTCSSSNRQSYHSTSGGNGGGPPSSSAGYSSVPPPYAAEQSATGDISQSAAQYYYGDDSKTASHYQGNNSAAASHYQGNTSAAASHYHNDPYAGQQQYGYAYGDGYGQEYQEELDGADPYEYPQGQPSSSSSSRHHQQQSSQQYDMRNVSTGSRMPPGVMDTPSAYSDPQDWQSDAGGRGGAAGSSTFPTHQPQEEAQAAQQGSFGFLNTDPYGRNNDQSSGSRLARNNTLGPNDSISAYNVPYASSHASASAATMVGNGNDNQYAYPTGRYSKYGVGDADDTYGEEGFQMYNNVPGTASGHSHGGAGGAAAKGSYGYATLDYAEDEYEQDRQMKHQSQSFYGDKLADASYADVHQAHSENPGLFSNQLAEADPGIYDEAKGGALDDKDVPLDKKDLLGFKSDSLERQIEKRRRGIGRQRWPIFTWIFALAYVAVFIVELIKAKEETGQAVQTKPSFNPMVGPSAQYLISAGARFTPCMKEMSAVPTTTDLACLNASTLSTVTTSEECPIWEICGLSSADAVGQYYRFIVPMFLHAGFVHILFNLLVQLTLCAQIEKLIGSPFYLFLYVAGGVGGYLLGANFGLIATPSVGASGAIYTCISIELIDLIYNWKYEYRVKTRVAVSIGFTIFGLALGLLPGLDNMSHLGGLAVGVLGGMIFCPSIHATRRHRLIVWACRILSTATLVAYFVLLSWNFATNDDPQSACEWCRYLSCLPVFSACKNNGLSESSSSSSSSSSRRDLFLL